MLKLKEGDTLTCKMSWCADFDWKKMKKRNNTSEIYSFLKDKKYIVNKIKDEKTSSFSISGELSKLGPPRSKFYDMGLIGERDQMIYIYSPEIPHVFKVTYELNKKVRTI